MKAAFCFSDTCIRNYLERTDPKFAKMIKIKRAWELLPQHIDINKKIRLLEGQINYMVENRFIGGVPKREVKIGIECPECGWALKWSYYGKYKRKSIRSTHEQKNYDGR